ncbi:hypothetical protein GUITHDRAFT_106372 [Guillardia theta CCMP2712]|uniref:PDZ domain-containing protein n=1 Tax=Guillardia theta (strain CCMP2712) TaxID=905079 RepID=L1JH40_GUITC|nr:hypothetical protein GUITHDRAFT_106372 [Guillardia theta CCMP2712]EKX47823.1 hypothetical protein GUITHDRAFT_106372 [Guillardia theta CCMP2712]|eukprot:XP_005834803.1 hypothetical protein GUITHDRAFT_106372 [Guillardia theta CCMP2712]
MNMNTYAVSPTNAANNNMMQYNIQPKYATAQMYNNFQQVQPVQTVSMRAMPYNSMQVQPMTTAVIQNRSVMNCSSLKSENEMLMEEIGHLRRLLDNERSKLPMEKVIVKEIPVEKEVIREIPVEKVVVKEVPFEVEKIVTRDVEVLIDKIVIKEIIQEIPVEKVVQREVPVEKFFEKVYEKHIEVPVEKVVNVEVPVDRIVYKERESPPPERRMVGIGLMLERLSNEYYTYVEEIVPGFAADLSGQIQVGDIVLYVNDISLEGMPLDDIKQASRMILFAVNLFRRSAMSLNPNNYDAALRITSFESFQESENNSYQERDHDRSRSSSNNTNYNGQKGFSLNDPRFTLTVQMIAEYAFRFEPRYDLNI